MFRKDLQYVRFCGYGFLKNLRLFEPFLILFLRDEGMSFTEIGILYALREIIRNIMEIPGGIVADVFGRRKSMITAFSSYIGAFILFYFSGSFAGFSLAVTGIALGDAFRTGTHKAMIMTYLNLKGWAGFKVDYYGHTRSWSQIGSGVSALLAGAVVFLSGQYRLAFLITLLPYVVNLINLATYPKELDQSRKQSTSQSFKTVFTATLKDFLQTFKNPVILRAMLGLSAYTGYYKAIKDYIQPVIQALALSLPLSWTGNLRQQEAIGIGVVYFLLFISTSWVSRHAGPFMRRMNNSEKAMRLSLLAGAAAGIAGGICILLESYIVGVLLYASVFLIENLRKPIGIGQIADELDEQVLASALSAESQAETLFAALFALMLGVLSDHLGLGAGISLTGVLVLFLIPLLFSRKKAA